MYWGEGIMTGWQVNVNYTHADNWNGYAQPSEAETYSDFIEKLRQGEDVTVFFYGDSITNGASASWCGNYEPFQLPYTVLFTQALADLFGYTVHYEDADLVAPNNGMATCYVPSKDYVAGTRGTITYVNTAIGGWTSLDGVTYIDTFIKEKIAAHGCDLFVVAFGMNDGGASSAAWTADNLEKIVDAVLAESTKASIMLVSTMLPNPAGIGWYGTQSKQEPELEGLAAEYIKKNVPCAVAHMTSVSRSVLEHKDFHDYSGNNINHPNDFFVRVYAQILLQTLIGYENMS